jgi:hypothetical protein
VSPYATPFSAAHVLVLVAVVLHGLGEAHRRIAVLEEGRVVAAAQVAVAAIDDGDGEPLDVPLAELLDGAGELTGGAVVLAAGAHERLLIRCHLLAGRDPFGEQPHLLAIHLAVGAARVADDVVRDHARHVELLVSGVLGPVAGAEQPLLLAGHGHEHDGGVELALRHHPRHLHHGRRARCVVVGAGGRARGVVLVGRARVVVAAHHVEAVLGLALLARQRGHHVDELGGFGDAAARRRHEFVELHLQAPTRLLL